MSDAPRDIRFCERKQTETLQVGAGLFEVESKRDRLVRATWGKSGRIIEMPDSYQEYVITPEAVDLTMVNAGLAPLLTHHRCHVEDQIGRIKAAWIEGGSVQLVAQFGHNPISEWLWRDLCDGIFYGCSLGHIRLAAEEVFLDVPLEKRCRRITRWAPRELTLSPVATGRDDLATIRFEKNLEELATRKLCEWSGERSDPNKLPDCYSAPLRERYPAIAKKIQERIGYIDSALIEATLREELDGFIARVA